MNNRIMVYILILLGAIAIIYRIANPPQPPAPGPTGGFPNWKSRAAVGTLASQAVNPAGTAWAGVWNEETQGGKMRSAVWIIDFKAFTARICKLSDGRFAPSLGWNNNGKIWVLTVDSKNPSVVTESSIQYVNASDGGRDGLQKLKTPITRVLAWPPDSKRFLAVLATEGMGLKFAVLSDAGNVIGKEVAPKLPKDTEAASEAALSSNGETFVFSVSDTKAGGGRAFYLGRSNDGTYAHAFDLTDVPGRIEGMWVANSQVLMICSAHEKLEVALYDLKSGKFTTLKKGIGAENLKGVWAGVPDEQLYVTYNGGFQVNVADGKVKKLFNFGKLGQQDDYWREQVRNGRLYPTKGGYISVSMSAGAVDIRELGKNGRRSRDLLARM